MKKTLIVIAHPNIDHSVVHRRWIEELKKYPEQFTVHQLYQRYPDGNIDVAKEQALIDSHDNLILQFPIYWFNSPPLLKQWLDDVFTYGWAYGSSGNQLKNKKIALAISAGIREADFSLNGLCHATMSEVLKPFQLTMEYVKADYRPFFALYGAETNGTEIELAKAAAKANQTAVDYIQFLSQL